jgi:hypothetical protein
MMGEGDSKCNRSGWLGDRGEFLPCRPHELAWTFAKWRDSADFADWRLVYARAADCR